MKKLNFSEASRTHGALISARVLSSCCISLLFNRFAFLTVNERYENAKSLTYVTYNGLIVTPLVFVVTRRPSQLFYRQTLGIFDGDAELSGSGRMSFVTLIIIKCSNIKRVVAILKILLFLTV